MSFLRKLNRLVKDMTAQKKLNIGVAYCKHHESAGTYGGATSSGDWRARTLNTLEGDTSFISLSGNYFTLAPGKYAIEGFGPISRSDGCQSAIYNSTDGAIESVGTGGTVPDANYVTSYAMAYVDIAIPKAYGFFYRTGSSSGGGDAIRALGFANVWTTEVYAQVKITKLA